MYQRIFSSAASLLLIGVIVLGFGIWKFTETGVSCGAQTMQPGQICQTSQYGQTTGEKTYEQQKDSNRTSGIISTAIGAACLAGSGFVFVSKRRKSAAQSMAENASAPVPPAAS
jgi:LPXTG-motif cell wall-anchored protein